MKPIGLQRNGQDYESDEYQSHIEKYETLTNRYEQLDGYQYESKIKTVLHGLNFTESDFNKPINDFSGGQKHVFLLLKCYLKNPIYSFLMNQSNHLDMETTKWLEDYLKYFKGQL